LETIHRADILNTMMPWPVRPPANIARYSVCGEPSRQCYTPPLPIQKAFVGHDPVPGSFAGNGRPLRQDDADVRAHGRFPDPVHCGLKISPHYRDAAEGVVECRRGAVGQSPMRDSAEILSVGGQRPDNQGNVQASAVAAAGPGKLTAARLIDAIIVNQINQDKGMSVSKSPGRASGSGNLGILERLSVETSSHDQVAAVPSPASADKQHQLQKPSPGCLGHPGVKDLTLGDHVASLIMHDFKQKDADAVPFDTPSSIGMVHLCDVSFFPAVCLFRSALPVCCPVYNLQCIVNY